MTILKRDGAEVPFNKDKIIVAIHKAFLEIDGTLYETDTANDIADEIENIIRLTKEITSVEEIQDYINTIYEYNVKFESKRIQEQMKKEADPTSKAILAQKLVELRLLKDKEMER